MLKIADIFNSFYDKYKEGYTPSPQQGKAALDIINCRTAALGAHGFECEECGYKMIFYNS